MPATPPPSTSPPPSSLHDERQRTLTRQELEHVVVVPSGFLAPGAHTGLGRVIAADEVDRDPAQDGQVARGAPVADAAVVFAEGDVEHPVQRVLDVPMG